MFYCMAHIKHIHTFNLNTGIHYYMYDQHLKENCTETLTSYFEKSNLQFEKKSFSFVKISNFFLKIIFFSCERKIIYVIRSYIVKKSFFARRKSR